MRTDRSDNGIEGRSEGPGTQTASPTGGPAEAGGLPRREASTPEGSARETSTREASVVEETSVELVPDAPEDEALRAEESRAGDARAGESRDVEPAPPAAEPSLEETAARALEMIRTLRAERDRLYDAWLRATADYDNYRKRTEREREEQRACAVESLLLQVLPVLDNFERALDCLPPGVPRGFAEGISLIQRMLADVLAKQGLTPIKTDGQLFDPHIHDAVETELRPDIAHHTILGERQRGYRLGQRVLRPARVRVSVRPDGDGDAEAGAGGQPPEGA